ncbi:MAG: ECF transporter S component [Acholeplasmataceae bacterium]
MSNYLRLKKMLYVVALAAIAIVIGLIQIPWGFLHLDFSEVVILLALLILGPKEAMLAAVLRSFVRAMFTGFLDPIILLGEILALLASFSIIMAYVIVRKILHKSEKPFLYEVPVNGNHTSLFEWIISILLISLSLTITLLVFNTLFSTPMYYTYFTINNAFSFVQSTGQNWGTYIWSNVVLYVPFNLVKGASVTILFLLIKPRIKYLEL